MFLESRWIRTRTLLVNARTAYRFPTVQTWLFPKIKDSFTLAMTAHGLLQSGFRLPHYDDTTNSRVRLLAASTNPAVVYAPSLFPPTISSNLLAVASSALRSWKDRQRFQRV
jgi:hypothetical protein